MKEILLTQGKVALVDDEDFEVLNKVKWAAHKMSNIFYAARNGTPINGKQKTILMHREILRPPKELHVDHVDHNGLNNQRHNLRIATRSQNMHNQGKRINNTSGYKGVCWDKQNKKWRTQIKLNGKIIFLGYFPTKEDAHTAYVKACHKYHGEFARPN